MPGALGMQLGVMAGQPNWQALPFRRRHRSRSANRRPCHRCHPRCQWWGWSLSRSHRCHPCSRRHRRQLWNLLLRKPSMVIKRFSSPGTRRALTRAGQRFHAGRGEPEPKVATWQPRTTRCGGPMSHPSRPDCLTMSGDWLGLGTASRTIAPVDCARCWFTRPNDHRFMLAD